MKEKPPTTNNKPDRLTRLAQLYRRYDGPAPRGACNQIGLSRDTESEKWLRFWRGQVLHAVYALRRQRAQRYRQRTRDQFHQWRGGVITRRKTLTSALRTYRSVQQQKNRPDKPGR